MKSKTLSVVDELAWMAHWVLQRNGLFHSHPRIDAVQVTAEDTRQQPTPDSHTRILVIVVDVCERSGARVCEDMVHWLSRSRAFAVASAFMLLLPLLFWCSICGEHVCKMV